jgi:hypothetical protein
MLLYMLQSGYCTVMAPSLGEKAKWLQALAKQQESKHRDATRAHSEKSKPVSTQVYTHTTITASTITAVTVSSLLVVLITSTSTATSTTARGASGTSVSYDRLHLW